MQLFTISIMRFAMRRGGLFLLLVGACMATVSLSASASLIPRAGNAMVYDADRNITWLADANYARTSGYDSDGRMTWAQALAWAESLAFGGFDDWRLPNSEQPDASCSNAYQGVSHGFGCRQSDMGHLFYDELGGEAVRRISLSTDPDVLLFSNIQDDPSNTAYWTGQNWPGDALWAQAFTFSGGGMGGVPVEGYYYAWAVRDGDVIPNVTEPGVLTLLSIGLAGWVGVARRRAARPIS